MHAQVSHIIPFRIRHSPLKNTPKQRVKQTISVRNLIMPYKYKKYSLFHEKCLVLTEKHVKRIFEKKKCQIFGTLGFLKNIIFSFLLTIVQLGIEI